MDRRECAISQDEKDTVMLKLTVGRESDIPEWQNLLLPGGLDN